MKLSYPSAVTLITFLIALLFSGCNQNVTSIDICKTGYIISEIGGDCLGTTEFELKGKIVWDKQGEENFDGYMQVNAYPVAEERLKQSGYFVSTQDGYIDIQYIGASFEIEDGKWRPDISGYSYWFYIDEDQPDNAIVFVTDWDDINARYYIVTGSDESDARSNLNEYLQTRFGEDYPLVS